ncbi:DUF58 domain-containing protein [Paenibacillus arenilitoris]|uniref:DUF58 domain-containing protein n=1 Tax=Paenibacillus arenilitoris TaxID=2772299 RepID=A0A927CQF7_9BACL|nr:DUF58 domain-containing protein [Paenibacillus arenilitoris]MBD2869770.1 DUF58 domain-containing protein [Paenibacillus arenilitoris]
MILFWFIVAALAILFVQSRIFRRFVLRRIAYRRHFQTKACFRGEQIELIEQISNAKWLPVPWLRVESQLSTHLHFQKLENFAVSSGQLYQNHKSFFSLAPYTKITRKHRITAARRGWYQLQTVTLTGGDLLGITNDSAQIPLSGQLFVYPKPAQVPVHELPYHSWQGDQSVRRWIVSDPFVIAGVRDYQPGDTFRQINWKSTAKTGHLQVHKPDYTADRRLMIYLNVDDAEGMWRTVSDEELIERGIEWAAGAAEAVIGQGMDAGFAANMPIRGSRESVCIEPRGGHEHLMELFEWMAKLQIERTELFHHLLEREALSGYSERDVLIITSYWNDALELQAERLRYNGNAVAVWMLTDKLTGTNADDAVAGNGRDGVSA